MANSTGEKPKLNIFALPSQTTLLFWLMVVVLLAAVMLGSIGRSPILIWPMAVGLLFLPLRAYLARPERDFKRFGLEHAGEEFAPIRQAIMIYAIKLGLKRHPGLVISQRDIPFHTFGTFRRWFIAIGREEAVDLLERIKNPATASQAYAMIIHELYHFKTGDYWKMGYTGELLKTTFIFLGWGIAFFYGLGLLLVVATPDFLALNPSDLISQIEGITPGMQQTMVQLLPSAADMGVMHQRAAGINMSLVLNFIMSAIFPLVLIAFLLWRFYWPKLWRTREYYADAGVVHTQGKIAHFLLSFIKEKSLKEREEKFQPREDNRFIAWWRKLYDGILDMSPAFVPSYGAYTEEGLASLFNGEVIQRSRGQKIIAWWKRVTSYHPEVISRINCVKNPALAFDTWWSTAFHVGSLTLLLDILLSSPLTLIHVGNWPMHFSTLVILVTVSLGFILPTIAQGNLVWLDLIKIVGLVVGLRLAWLAFTVLALFVSLVMAPEYLSEALEAAVASVAHYAGYADDLGFADITSFLLRAALLNLAQILIIFFLLLFSLYSIAWLLRRLLTWYGFPQVEIRLMPVASLVVVLWAIFTGFTILMPITLALLHPADLIRPVYLILELIGFLLACIGIGVFTLADRKFSKRCPKCGTGISGFYWLGKCCENDQCKEKLLPWLIAEYEV